MGKNPRTTKIEKMTLKEESSDTNSSENSTPDESNSPQNEAIDYEKQRKLRIAENNARMEAMGLHRIANSLMKLGGKRKKVVKTGKEDDEYQPSDYDDDDELRDDDSDCSSSEEFGKRKSKKKKGKKEKVSATIQKVEPPAGVFIPESSLRFSGHCGEKIYLKFPKATKEEVKDLMSRYPKGFNGFNREQGERAFTHIADLKARYFRLRRSYIWYPEFREDVVEGLPFPKGFNGFNLEQSKEISEVILTLENCYYRLEKWFQPNMHEVRDRKLKSGKQVSLQKQLENTELMDEDNALKQAIALSLSDIGQYSDLQRPGLSLSRSSNHQAATASPNEKRKNKIFKSRVQMTEDDVVINFCQFDEVGKGSITFSDLKRMADSHDFTWSDKQLAEMIRCFDSDRDGKLSMDDFRNVVLRCNMLQVPEIA